MNAPMSLTSLDSAFVHLSDAVRMNSRRLSGEAVDVDLLDVMLSNTAEYARTARAAIEAEERARAEELDRLTAAFHAQAHEPDSAEAEGAGCASCRRCAVIAWRLLAAPGASS